MLCHGLSMKVHPEIETFFFSMEENTQILKGRGDIDYCRHVPTRKHALLEPFWWWTVKSAVEGSWSTSSSNSDKSPWQQKAPTRRVPFLHSDWSIENMVIWEKEETPQGKKKKTQPCNCDVVTESYLWLRLCNMPWLTGIIP